MGRGPGHADCTTPVVDHEIDRSNRLDCIQPFTEIGHSTGQCVAVLGIAGTIGQPHADMIRHQTTLLIAQAENQVPVIERPGRIAMHHDNRRCTRRTLVKVVHPVPRGESMKMPGKRIERRVDTGWMIH